MKLIHYSTLTAFLYTIWVSAGMCMELDADSRSKKPPLAPRQVEFYMGRRELGLYPLVPDTITVRTLIQQAAKMDGGFGKQCPRYALFCAQQWDVLDKNKTAVCALDEIEKLDPSYESVSKDSPLAYLATPLDGNGRPIWRLELLSGSRLVKISDDEGATVQQG